MSMNCLDVCSVHDLCRLSSSEGVSTVYQLLTGYDYVENRWE